MVLPSAKSLLRGRQRRYRGRYPRGRGMGVLRPLETSGAEHRNPGRDQQRRPLLRTMLGATLRRARRAQDRTLADVARSAKVSMQYLSELERGRKEASSEVLAAICAALRIDLPDLLTEVGRRLAEAQGQRVIRLGSAVGIGFGGAEDPRISADGPAGPQPEIQDHTGIQDRYGDPVCLLAA
jgi:transcriptional regulator with XRE-family HTH domain